MPARPWNVRRNRCPGIRPVWHEAGFPPGTGRTNRPPLRRIKARRWIPPSHVPATPWCRRPRPRRVGLPPLAWAAVVLLLGLACTGIVAHREWRDLQQRAEDARRALAD